MKYSGLLRNPREIIRAKTNIFVSLATGEVPEDGRVANGVPLFKECQSRELLSSEPHHNGREATGEDFSVQDLLVFARG